MVLMMEAVRTSETSVYFNETTRRFISEGCHLHIRRRENLKSHVTVYDYPNCEHKKYCVARQRIFQSCQMLEHSHYCLIIKARLRCDIDRGSIGNHHNTQMAY
jgi:hypothetical protein